MVEELDEIIDQLYIDIHQYLVKKLGTELSEDIIDINLETRANNEVMIEISLYLELSPFSDHDVQNIAEEAVKRGIEEADRVLPDFVVRIKHKKDQ